MRSRDHGAMMYADGLDGVLAAPAANRETALRRTEDAPEARLFLDGISG